MTEPRVLDNMTFQDIRQLITAKRRPKQPSVIAEQTRFPGSYGEYTPLCSTVAEDVSQSAEDDLLQMCLINGLHDTFHHTELLEYIQAAESSPSLDDCLQFAQQLELIKDFDGQRTTTDHTETEEFNVAHMKLNSSPSKS